MEVDILIQKAGENSKQLRMEINCTLEFLLTEIFISELECFRPKIEKKANRLKDLSSKCEMDRKQERKQDIENSSLI